MSLPIRTDRLVVRELTASDTDGLARAFADPEVIWWDRPFSADKARAWVTRALDGYATSGLGLYAVALREDGRLIGDCGLVPRTIAGEDLVEIGWHLARDVWQLDIAV